MRDLYNACSVPQPGLSPAKRGSPKACTMRTYHVRFVCAVLLVSALRTEPLVAQQAGGATEVVRTLGTPTWLQLRSDKLRDWPLGPTAAFAFIWRNGNCNPLVATFDIKQRLIGLNEGRAVVTQVNTPTSSRENCVVTSVLVGATAACCSDQLLSGCLPFRGLE
jgi:hypothetical protein